MKDINKKQVFNTEWNNQGHFVAPGLLPNEPGTMNLAGKVIANAGILAMFHMRLFGNCHDLVMGRDFTKLIDNPGPGYEDKVDTWNDFVNFIIEKERDCEYMLELMERVGKARRIPEGTGADEDIYAHTETLGRWHFDAKTKAGKKNRR